MLESHINYCVGGEELAGISRRNYVNVKCARINF